MISNTINLIFTDSVIQASLAMIVALLGFVIKACLAVLVALLGLEVLRKQIRPPQTKERPHIPDRPRRPNRG